MNTEFQKKLLMIAVLSACFQVAGAAIGDKDNCNASDNVTGWGIWCGSDTYFASITENQPTAAGPEASTMPDIAVETLGSQESDRYGGKVKPPEDDDVSPPETPEPPVVITPVPDVQPPIPDVEPPINDDVLPLALLEDDSLFKGYWVASNNERSMEEAPDGGESETAGIYIDNSVTGYDIGTIGVDLIDNGMGDGEDNTDSILQNFYDRKSSQVDTYSSQGNLSERESSKDEDGGTTYNYRSNNAYVNIYAPDQQGRSRAQGDKGEEYYYYYRKDGVSNSRWSSGDGGEQYTYNSELSSEDIGKSNSLKVLKSYWQGFTSFTNSSGYNNTDGEIEQGAWNYSATEYTSVYGVLTPLTEIQRMISGNVRADYSGNSALYRQDVAINVDFGQKNWSGSWTASDKIDTGAFDFTASGNIKGQHIVSTAIGGATGLVQGSFFGAEAKNLGGAYEVTKGTKTIRDVFATTKGADKKLNLISGNVFEK